MSIMVRSGPTPASASARRDVDVWPENPQQASRAGDGETSFALFRPLDRKSCLHKMRRAASPFGRTAGEHRLHE